ncbi:hypothetical protein GCM10010844_44190 [Deinococcus radiotolerans]|uniref:Uncharacterized protein n=1 Tax=Deinococcus radiotolerans TaxID=1309407 RepID=A0ABQ2FS11_9DEIO|nr:hypothetical protein GCM10010844_44190 [Deinococcus radiotolerans]
MRLIRCHRDFHLSFTHLKSTQPLTALLIQMNLPAKFKSPNGFQRPPLPARFLVHPTLCAAGGKDTVGLKTSIATPSEVPHPRPLNPTPKGPLPSAPLRYESSQRSTHP